MEPDTTGEDVGPAIPLVPPPVAPQRPTTLSAPLVGTPSLTIRNGAEISAATAFPRLPIPTLTESTIDGYFLSMEFWFKASGVVDDTRKYNTVMSQIPPSKLLELKTIIAATPTTGKYDYIRDKLLHYYTESQQRRLCRVLSDMPPGDQKPSRLYNAMLRVADGALAESALFDLWVTRLPQYSHAAIIASGGTITFKLQVADLIIESLDLRSSAQINNVELKPHVDNSGPDEVKELMRNINVMIRKIK